MKLLTLYLFLYGAQALKVNHADDNDDLVEMTEESADLPLTQYDLEEDEDLEEGEQMRDTSARAYTGDKCTYNMRRMDDSSTST